jgi:hypothetical protein
MWIESHQELGSHPKTKRLARALGISLPAAVGHLHYLWWWTLDYGENGSLAKYTPEDIADAMLWEGDADALIEALLSCGIGGGGGFLNRDSDGRLSIHDWEQYVGRLEHARDQNRKKQQRWRDRHVTGVVTRESPEDNGYVTGYATNSNPATVPNLTVPNQTKPNTTKPIAVADAPAPAARKSKPQTVTSERKPPASAEQFVALAEEQNLELSAIPPSARGALNKHASECLLVGWTHDQIHEIGRRWRLEHPDIPVTSGVVVMHGARLLASQPRASPNGTGRKNPENGRWPELPLLPVRYWKEGDDEAVSGPG